MPEDASCEKALDQPLRTFLDGAPHPVAVQDAEGRIVYTNAAFAEHFGIRPATALERVAVNEIPESERPGYVDWMRGWRAGRSQTRRLVVRMRDGQLRPHFLLPQPIRDAAGRYRGTALTILDETSISGAVGDRLRAGGAVLRSVLADLVGELDRALRHAEAVEVGLEELRRTVPGLRALTGREWAVASRIARGDRTSSVAAELDIAANTVRNHLKAIFRKTGVGSQAELLERFRQWRRSAPAHSPRVRT